MLMRLVWPVLEPPLPLFDLIDIARDDVDEVVARHGYIAVHAPFEWMPRPGSEVPGFSAHRLVLTCLVEVQRVTTREAA